MKHADNGTSRRALLKLGAVACTVAAIGPRAFASDPGQPSAASSPQRAAVKNRAPLQASAFYPLPTGSIRPEGWLRDQLYIQANGLGGHLDETWPDVGANSGWLGGTGESWERGPYFLDGLIPLAWQLDDARLKAKAMKFIEWTLTHQQPSGLFGPASNQDWWPRMVMLKALTQYEEATGDPRVIPLMERYFAFQASALPTRPLSDWGKYRWQDEVLSVLWLYNRNGDPKLLTLALLLKQQGYDWQAQFANFHYTEPCTVAYLGLGKMGDNNERAMQTHGVNNAQALKASPVWWLVTGANEERTAFARQLGLLDQYHGLPNGMFSADEHLAGRDPSHGTELCTVVETMFSLEQALAILGDPSIGDRLEKIAYNALPGTFTDDMWAHQYNQQPNQVEVSLHNKPWTTDGPESNLFGLEPNFGCCTANFHQGWPKLTASLWMLSHDDGIAAVAYAPCRATAVVRGIPVEMLEETEYPFRETIRITVSPRSTIAFPLRLRIPAWAEGAKLLLNGREVAIQAGSFAVIDREWNMGDRVELKFPLKPRVVRGYRESVSVERGPLVFSYPIGEDWVKLRDRGMTADWQVFPSTQWNYALTAGTSANALKVTESPLTKRPFALSSTPVSIEMEAIRLPQWHAEDGVATLIPQSPVSLQEASVDKKSGMNDSPKFEMIKLVPYAAAKLRITSFPEVKGNA
jgi:hypothetical protein